MDVLDNLITEKKVEPINKMEILEGVRQNREDMLRMGQEARIGNALTEPDEEELLLVSEELLVTTTA